MATSELAKLFNFLKMKIIGYKRFVFLLLFLTALTEDVHTRVMTKKCARSEDCEEDYVCSEGVCQNCFDCGLLFREGPSCVVDFKECGSCLEGYKDYPVTDFSSVIKPCEEIESNGYSEECLGDHHCPFDNYCHEKSCVKCFDCSLYNRVSPNRNCAKEPEDCSSCLNGFYEVPVTSVTNSKPCQKITSDSVKSSSSIHFYESSFFFSLLAVFDVFMIAAIFIYKRSQGKSKQVIELQCLSPRPPPYPTDTLQYVREPESEVEEESSFFTYVEEGKDQPNTARVFRLPRAPYYYAGQDNIDNLFEDQSEDEEEENVNSDVDDGAQPHNSIPLVSNNIETEEDDFEVISESEIDTATVGDANIAYSTSTDVTQSIEEGTPTSEESKNPDEGEVLQGGDKNDLTK